MGQQNQNACSHFEMYTFMKLKDLQIVNTVVHVKRLGQESPSSSQVHGSTSKL